MELSIGDVVVVPALGLGVVEARESVNTGAGEVAAFRIVLEEHNLHYWAPVDRVGELGLRKPMKKERIKALWAAMTSQEAPEKPANWNRRSRRFQEILMSNEPILLAEMVGELVATKLAKKEKKAVLSFGERRLLARATGLIAAELAAIKGVTVEFMEARIGQRLGLIPA